MLIHALVTDKHDQLDAWYDTPLMTLVSGCLLDAVLALGLSTRYAVDPVPTKLMPFVNNLIFYFTKLTQHRLDNDCKTCHS